MEDHPGDYTKEVDVESLLPCLNVAVSDPGDRLQSAVVQHQAVNLPKYFQDSVYRLLSDSRVTEIGGNRLDLFWMLRLQFLEWPLASC